jgi:glycosyltransferase involved in cell wall biosynthesis
MLICPFYMRHGFLVANYFVTFYPVFVASFIFRRPYVYLVQDIETWFEGSSGVLLNFMCRLTWRSRQIVSVYAYVAQELKRRGIPLLGEIQAGVAECFFRQAPCADSKSFDLIVFPRIEPWKRLDLLKKIILLYRQQHGSLSVLCAFQDAQLLGQFDAIGCQELCPTTEAELIDGFDRSRVVLFTSAREGLGMPPLEGMARGLPAVVYENGGSSVYMRDDENGFVIESGDEVGAVSALHRLLSEALLYERMSLAARETARMFSMNRAFSVLDSIMCSIRLTSGRQRK